MADTAVSAPPPPAALVSIHDDHRFERTIQILSAYFQSNDDDARPDEGPLEGWNNCNKFYFLKGILTYAEPVNYTFNGTTERRDRNFYADEFARMFGTHTGRETEPSPNHQMFSKNILRRDGVCLFCWYTGNAGLEAVHLIPKQRDGTGCSQSLLVADGIDADDVQNGVLLFSNCQDAFYHLRRYIDITHGHEGPMRFWAKIMNNNVTNEDPDLYPFAINDLKKTRRFRKALLTVSNLTPMIDWIERQAENERGEMEVYFTKDSDPQHYPSEVVLRLHKSACLVWRSAMTCKEESDNRGGQSS
ncbi:hypothetical protein HDU96_008117 [Phlyctochytrium bullatum]|nr:hypothetical protein HDU96_008117 [Phlyctochytrium bullatum]